MNENYIFNYLKENEGVALLLNEDNDIQEENNLSTIDENKEIENNNEFNTLEYYYQLETLNEKILKYNKRR